MNIDELGNRVHRILLAFITATIVFVLACCGGLILFGDRPTNGIRVERLEADIRRSLPVGSTWQEASAWFVSHNIQAGGAKDVLTGLPAKLLLATIPNDSLLESAEIRIAIYFDEDCQLTKIDIYRFVYCL